MQKIISLVIGFLLLGSSILSTQAAFTSLYVFGDGVSATTNGPGGAYYYGPRNSNGRLWVEVLAQRQGLVFDTSKNWSYFGNTSTTMVATVSSLNITSSDAGNTLFVVWVNNADLFYPALNNGTDMNAWANAMNLSLTNHVKAITSLYQKGARTLVMPNAVDLSMIPKFNSSANTNFYHQRVVDYNVAFANILNQARTNSNYPGLTIYSPDFFTLLTNLVAHPASYDVTNTLYHNRSIDAIQNPLLSDKTANGPGTNYIFWDSTDPTAKVHMWMANLTQQLISPARISQIVPLNGADRLDLVNVPVGQYGQVLGCTNQASWDWTTNATFVGSNVTQSVFVPVSTLPPKAPLFIPNDGPPDPPGGGGGGTNGPTTMQLYQLHFPCSWTWP